MPPMIMISQKYETSDIPLVANFPQYIAIPSQNFRVSTSTNCLNSSLVSFTSKVSVLNLHKN